MSVLRLDAATAATAGAAYAGLIIWLLTSNYRYITKFMHENRSA